MHHQEFDYQTIAQLAFRLWIERGRPIGSPEEDWKRALAILRGDEKAFGAASSAASKTSVAAVMDTPPVESGPVDGEPDDRSAAATQTAAPARKHTPRAVQSRRKSKKEVSASKPTRPPGRSS